MSTEFNQMGDDSHGAKEELMEQNDDQNGYQQTGTENGDNNTTANNNGGENSQDDGNFNGNGNGNGNANQEEGGNNGDENGNGDGGEGGNNGIDKSNLEPEQFRKVFIGGLSYKTDDDALKAYFSKYGDLVDHVVMKDGQTGRSRGFGFVTYSSSTMVDELMKNRPHIIDGRQVEPKRATPREVS